MNALAIRFTKFRSAYSTEVAQRMFSPEQDNRFRDRGFRRIYQDHEGEDSSPNQVRHAVGGLIAGYLWGVDKGGPFMNSREDRNTPSGRADIALNSMTIPMGEKIGKRSWGGSTIGARLAAARLGSWIRENLCGK